MRKTGGNKDVAHDASKHESKVNDTDKSDGDDDGCSNDNVQYNSVEGYADLCWFWRQ